jgi:hypothetical protein
MTARAGHCDVENAEEIIERIENAREIEEA